MYIRKSIEPRMSDKELQHLLDILVKASHAEPLEAFYY